MVRSEVRLRRRRLQHPGSHMNGRSHWTVDESTFAVQEGEDHQMQARKRVEARARAEALVRDELGRIDSLRAQVVQLESRVGWTRRVAAALAGSRLAGLLADYGTAGRRRRWQRSATEQGAELRRRRFRLTRRKRVLKRGLPASPPAPLRGPLWLRELGLEAFAGSGPAQRQRVLADLLAGDGEACRRAARVAIGSDCPLAVADAVAELGLQRVADEADADVAILIAPDGQLAFDWILAGERSMASAGALAERLEAGDGAAALAEALATSARASALCIRVAARNWEAAGHGGDVALARSLARALGERGHQALLQVDAEAGEPLADCLDVLLVLRGRRAGEPTPGRLNLLWLISHPEEVEEAELDRYDHVLVASRSYAQRLAPLVRPPVEPMLQFTDPELFHPAPDPERRHAVAFVGNWRGEFRRIVWDAIEAGHPPALYGRGWDLLAPERAVAEHVPHADLARLYSSCDVLLCDHWDDMRRHGFVSNRVFDALACETFVIADDNPALAEELPGAVVTYSSPAELREELDRYLAQPDERKRIARRGRAMVLAEHTVERRAERLLEIVAAANRKGTSR